MSDAPKQRPAIGSLWKDNDPRENRTVYVHRIDENGYVVINRRWRTEHGDIPPRGYSHIRLNRFHKAFSPCV